MPKYFLNELTKYISDQTYPHIPIQHCAVDSRLVEPQGLFFALPGMKTDGHLFLSQAAQKGAAAAIVNNDYTGSDHGLILIKVPNPLHALQNIARQMLKQRRVKIVGITGSVGKTTTKEFTYHLLKQKYKVMASPGNSNTQTGLPLNILNLTDGTEQILVLEMGMTEAGQIRKLVSIAPPEVAVITTTALVHAQNFTSLEAIGLAKAEIFSDPQTRLGIVHKDIANFNEIITHGHCRKESFSLLDSSADFYADLNENLVLTHCGKKVILPLLPIPGEHNSANFLAAIAVAKYFNLTWEEIAQAIPSLILPQMRFEQIKKNGITFVNDSYNASEISVKAAIKTLPSPLAGGKKIAVLGAMLELGKFSERCHFEVGKFALNYIDEMICLGKECRVIYDLWKAENRPVHWVSSLEEVAPVLEATAQPGDIVLLKGSRANQLWKILDYPM